ncbi:hypothetical protein P175DRAFT_0500689 [Aspergillus ochraceoroseus IBT 24754]|uniref:PH-response regulator protein palI/RIM9 n=2 Tax=Aspergillus ochraceoroseus TaxID=138278 RepID=A0A2T5LZV1_9EURO|nr:uncharacterized protein P175DRAFT_0500689 [Aspergillus ochraceoroseus IBT 24754]PTU21803.1 hypothetical protein P175DRAFT_0500689 [Aspergillus ochraceoroseus IBT 24754]
MLLKPATPLTILLLIAFALLLLSVLSTPIIKSIPLATFENVEYGVFGYCKAGKCSNLHVGYTTQDIDNTGDGDDFNLPSSARRSLSSILIIHPVAALLTLICLCLAAAAHFHGPSHSPRYLLGLLILLLPTLLVSLLAFLVDILLFVPHMSWGGWIVLAATIILVSCGVVTCAMRRTLVSRKARKRRIAENAEMNGENYYNRQNAAAAALSEPKSIPPETKEAFVTASHSSDSAPTFATFPADTRESDDDRTPLNSRSNPSMSESTYPSRIPGDPVPYNSSRDELGNPMPPAPYGPGSRARPGPTGPLGPPGPPDSRMRDPYSDPRRGPPPGFNSRGRGGYPPRGGYGRGGPYAGGPYGPGPRGPPPPGRGGSIRGGPQGMMGRGYRPQPNGGYGPGPGPRMSPPMGEDQYGYRGPSPPTGPRQSPGPIGIAVSADSRPVGQSIEMTPQPRRDLDPQDALLDSHQPHAVSTNQYGEPISPSSLYSRTPSYVPPRANWGPNEPRNAASPAPNPAYEPAEPEQQPHHIRSHSGSAYYEDVDPAFASRTEPAAGNTRLPSVLTAGNSTK